MTANACILSLYVLVKEFLAVVNRGLPYVVFILSISFISGKIFSVAKLSGS
jgi:hypothetical protein